jgi:hypothetical protein
MVKMCSRWVNLVHLSENDNSIFLEAGDRLLIVEKAASRYPAFEAEIPPDVECPVTFPDVDALVGIVRQAEVIGEGKSAEITIGRSRGRIQFVSNHELLGAYSRGYNSADAIEGAPVAVNGDYLLAALGPLSKFRAERAVCHFASDVETAVKLIGSFAITHRAITFTAVLMQLKPTLARIDSR